MCVLSRVGSCDDGEVVVEAAAAANVRRKKERKKETEKDSCSRSSWGRERERERSAGCSNVICFEDRQLRWIFMDCVQSIL